MTPYFRLGFEIGKVRQQLLLCLPENLHFEIENSMEATINIEQTALTYIISLKKTMGEQETKIDGQEKKIDGQEKKIKEQELEIWDLKAQVCYLEACLSDQEDDSTGGVSIRKAKGGSTET